MAHSNHELIAYLMSTGILKTAALIDAFRSVDRADFIPQESIGVAYEDYPIPIGWGQTISQPYTVAFMLELLQLEPGQKVLDIGSGSGWTTALLSKAVGPNGDVVGVERVPELVSYGQENLRKYRFDNARIEFAESIGWPAGAPFDRVLVSAAGKEVPKALLKQLRPGGVMVIPVENTIVKIQKDDSGKAHEEVFGGFAFVPLIH